MKKIIYLAAAALFAAVLLTACQFNYHPSGSTIISGEVQTPETAQEPIIEGKILTEVSDGGRINVDYILLGGFDDIVLQDAINSELYTFCMWPTFSMEDRGKNITVTADYAIIGGKYISIRTYDSVYEGAAAYSVNNFRAITLDLETGENAGWVDDYINIETVRQPSGMLIGYENIGDLLTLYFTQVYPEEQFGGAIDMFVDRIDEEVYSLEFYLTEDAVGLCVAGLPHAVGGYLIFEADYDGIRSLLTEKLLSVLD